MLFALIFLLPPLELVHWAVEAECLAESHKGGLGHHRLEGDQDEAPPGQEHGLPVGQYPGHHGVCYELWLQNREDFTLDDIGLYILNMFLVSTWTPANMPVEM